MTTKGESRIRNRSIEVPKTINQSYKWEKSGFKWSGEYLRTSLLVSLVHSVSTLLSAVTGEFGWVVAAIRSLLAKSVVRLVAIPLSIEKGQGQQHSPKMLCFDRTRGKVNTLGGVGNADRTTWLWAGLAVKSYWLQAGKVSSALITWLQA